MENVVGQMFELVVFDVVMKGFVGDVMCGKLCCIDQIFGGYCIKDFFQVLCLFGYYDVYNGIFLKYMLYGFLRNV